MAREFSFGFLNQSWSLEFDGGHIAPVPQFDESSAALAALTHQDGFFYYPAPSQGAAVEPMTDRVLGEIPAAKRPAPLFRLPPSHTLNLLDVNTDEPHRESHAFVLHLLGYLFGIRLQFGDWYFDSRVPIKLLATHNIHFSHATCQDFVSHSYRIWRGLQGDQRRLLINGLAMHCRAPSYYWDWERFMTEYAALDALWRLAELQRGIHARKHRERIHKLCVEFGIEHQKEPSKEFISQIAKLRNDLFHEATWDGSQPCMATGDGFRQTYNLRRLNQRLIPALLGYTTRYTVTPWWSIDAFLFDRA